MVFGRSGSSLGELEYRQVHLNTARVAEHRFCSNKVITYMYTWYNWLPKVLMVVLYENTAYVYFILMTILQCIPTISNTGGFPTLAPILLVLIGASSAMKLIEDRARRRDDIAQNTTVAHCKRGGAIRDETWTDVKVGDVVKITNHENIPADVLILAAHELDPNVPRAACHVETKGLDGETNLKGKAAPGMLAARMGATLEAQLKAASQVSGYVECEQPNAATNKFAGNLHLAGEAKPEPITIGNMLLRGSSLRNTEYVLALVVNTGVDTKVMQGARKAPGKTSTLDKQTTDTVVICAALMTFLCFICTIGNVSRDGAFDSAWYLFGVDADNVVIIFFQNVALLNSFISVMLPFSVASIKAFHKWFSQQSLAMYHEETDTPMKVRSMNLVDEVGIISHIFSDKTGTLTQNVMQFRKCSIGGVNYGHGTTEMGLARLKRLGLPLPPNAAKGGSEASGANKVVNFDGPELFAALNGDAGAAQQTLARDFFLHLALCHTVVAETVGNDKRLSAASPDEAALVAAAAYFGLDFIDRNQEKVQLHDHYAAADLWYEVLDVLEFTSARRRMSVVARDCATGALRLLTKGADTVMLKLLAPGQQGVAEMEQSMEDHSNDGLRCLVVGQKDLAAAEYLEWSAKYRAALSDISEIEKKGADLPNAIDALMDELEVGLQLLGSTAIEDKLQDGVPSCIADLGRAGIACWVLTGDKQETAINIAFACQLVDTTNKIHIISKKTHPAAADVKAQLSASLAEVEAEQAAGGTTKHALVIDGESLEVVMKLTPDGMLVGEQLLFLRFTQYCTSVVCCRCAPTQKAQVVSLVRYSVKGAVALAIGDGANDVPMIQAADVGVGISGQEGMQAANSADFALAQFRYLRELLLVQGRNMYRRQTTMVLYVFYKSIMMVLTTFWFAFFSAMTGQKMNLEIGVQAFNVVWTGVPIYFITLFDRDVSDETSRCMPQLYHLGIRRAYTSWWTFLRWFVEALYESAVITFICVHALPRNADRGADPGVWWIGAHTMTAVILVVNAKLLLYCWQYTRMFCTAVAAMCAAWWGTSYIADMQFCEGETFSPAPCMYYQLDIFVPGWQGMWQIVQKQAIFWFLLLLLVPTALIPPAVVDLWRKRFYPEFRDLCIEAEYFNLPMAALHKWEVPLALRSLPLLETAPSMTPQPRFFARKRVAEARIGGVV